MPAMRNHGPGRRVGAQHAPPTPRANAKPAVSPREYGFSPEECQLLLSIAVMGARGPRPSTGEWRIGTRPLTLEEFATVVECLCLDPYTASALLSFDPSHMRLTAPVVPVLSVEQQREYEAREPRTAKLRYAALHLLAMIRGVDSRGLSAVQVAERLWYSNDSASLPADTPLPIALDCIRAEALRVDFFLARVLCDEAYAARADGQ